MMRNTTMNLPDDLVQRAKSYAAQNGTTMTALVREHLERVTGYREQPALTDDPLVAFCEGRIASNAAMRALGLRDYAQLLVSLGQRDLPMPKLPAHEVEAMVDTFIRLYQQDNP